MDDLKTLCLEAGCDLVEERAFPEAFGSRLTALRREPFEYRIVWDGKEGWFLLETRLAPTGSEQDRAFQEIHREVTGRPPFVPRQVLALREALARRLL